MPRIKLPGPLARLKPIHWAIIAGVILAVLYLATKKGGSTASAGVSGGAGGGESSVTTNPLDTGNPVTVPNPVPPLTPPVDTNPVPGGTQTPLGGLPGSVDLRYPGTGLLEKYPSLAQFPRDQFGTINYGSAAAIPGMGDVSSATQADWTAKLGGNFANVGNPDPAQQLAQWLEVQRTGTFLPNDFGIGGQPRQPVSSQDLEAGLAYAKAYAQAAGVTQEQLDMARQDIIDRYGASLSGGVNTTPFAQAVQTARSGGAPLPSSWEDAAGALVSGINYGAPAAGDGQGGSPSASAGATSDQSGAIAARIATLNAAILTQTKNVQVNTAAGKLSNAAIDQATLDKYRQELASLQPVKA